MANVEAGAFHRRNMVVNAFEELTVDATVGGIPLTAGTYGTNRYAVIVCETADIRVTLEGTAPTTTRGLKLYPDDEIELFSNETIVDFRAIRTGSVSGKLQCFYGEIKLTS